VTPGRAGRVELVPARPGPAMAARARPAAGTHGALAGRGARRGMAQRWR